MPGEFVDRLLPEIVGLWKTRGDAVPNVVLRPTDRVGTEIRLDDGATEELAVLSGPAVQLVAWATGRGLQGLMLDGSTETIPTAPRWL